MVTPDTVVLLSGGTDSTVALASAIADGRHPMTVTFLYRQSAASNETAAARRYGDANNPGEREG